MPNQQLQFQLVCFEQQTDFHTDTSLKLTLTRIQTRTAKSLHFTLFFTHEDGCDRLFSTQKNNKTHHIRVKNSENKIS